MLHAEGHRGRVCADVQFAEQTCQRRIGDFVVDHESGVDRDVLSDHDGVGVTAGVSVAVEERKVAIALEQMRAAQPRDAGTDDGGRIHVEKATNWPSRRIRPCLDDLAGTAGGVG